MEHLLHVMKNESAAVIYESLKLIIKTETSFHPSISVKNVTVTSTRFVIGTLLEI